MAMPRSTKERIVLAAERLFAERGLEGVSLRQIGLEADNANHSAVQYHFGSRDQLIDAIFAYRLPDIHERRRMLTARTQPADLRGWAECYVLPVLEQGERQDSHYLAFVAMIAQRGRQAFESISDEFLEVTEEFVSRVESFVPHITEPLRQHRISQTLMFCIHAAADRERARDNGLTVLPFAVHVADLLDGLMGFLEAPVSPTTLAALEGAKGDFRVLMPL